MSAHTDRYLVVGNPIAHSRSPEIHRAFARQFGEDIAYDKVQLDAAGFAGFVDEFAHSGGRGLNVTVPLKVTAFDYVDVCDDLARAAGAVNTIVLAADLPKQGFNTDGIGLLSDLRGRHKLELGGKTVLLLGAGGAAQGVIEPLLQARPRCLMVANRSVDKARALVERHRARAGEEVPVLAMSLDNIDKKPDVIINATSSGLSGNGELIDPAWVADAFCYDMSYGAAAVFCGWAARHGARRSVDGLGMLVEQAAASYFLWRGKRPRTEPVVARLRSTLVER